MIKKLSLVFALTLFSLLVGQTLHHLKDGFSLRRIPSLDYQITQDWDEEADLALQQTFRYLGRGRQCFAFESEDGKYVLKFPRTDIYKTPFWARLLPIASYRAQLEKTHQARKQFVLDSFALAFDELKNQTGLLAIHLGQSHSTGKKLTIVDAAGCKCQIPLEKAPFVLQYKKPLFMKALSAALEKGQRKEAEKILDALVYNIRERAKKGILNRDRSFLRNYGYEEGKVYQIDVGSFFRSRDLSPSASYQKSLLDSLAPVQEWLAENAPQMVDYLNHRLQANLELKSESPAKRKAADIGILN